MNRFLLLAMIIVFSAGCGHIAETVKVIWGSSTRALEEARADAITKTYSCSLDACFDAVLALARDKRVYVDYNEESEQSDEETDQEEPDAEEQDADETADPATPGQFDIFIKNRAKRHIVVMGVRGNVDTTEVGIFFFQPNLTTVKLEVSSLSSSAKRTVAETIFGALDGQFSAAE